MMKNALNVNDSLTCTVCACNCCKYAYATDHHLQ